jgi:hypothetical protein
MMKPMKEFLNNGAIPKSASKVREWHLQTQTEDQVNVTTATF